MISDELRARFKAEQERWYRPDSEEEPEATARSVPEPGGTSYVMDLISEVRSQEAIVEGDEDTAEEDEYTTEEEDELAAEENDYAEDEDEADEYEAEDEDETDD